jgi:hypothetical protein
MRLFIDNFTNQVTWSVGIAEQVKQLRFRRGDTAPIEVQYYENGVIVERPPGSTGRLSLKEKGKYSQAAIVAANSWTKTGSGSTALYTFTPSFSGSALTTLLGDKPYVDLMFEIEWMDGESIESTSPLPDSEIIARVWNDVNKPDEEEPDPGPDPYPTSDRLILHFHDVTGWSGAGGLSTVPTSAIPTNRMVAFLVNGKPRFAQLIAGTNATSTGSNPVYQRPDDYHADTNARVWISYDIPDPTESVITDPALIDLTDLEGFGSTALAEGTVLFVRDEGFYVVRDENVETSLPWVVKPADFHETTNVKVFVRILNTVEAAQAITGLMGGDATDLDSIPTVFMSEGQVMQITGSDKTAFYRLEEKTYSPITVTSVSSNRIFTAGALPAVNDVVEFFTTVTLPTGLTLESFVYVVEVNDADNWFKVSTTHRGLAQTISSAGTGTHSFIIHEDPWWVYPRDHDDSGMAWKLIGPEASLSWQVFRNQDPLVVGRQFAGFAPVTMLPHRVQFDLAANGGSAPSIGLESDAREIIAGGNITVNARCVDTVDASATVNGKIFQGDEIIADIASSGGAKGLTVHVAGIVAPILGPTVGGGATDSELGTIIAVAGVDQSVSEGSFVTLDASGSTANTGAITYSWARISGPSVTLSSSSAAQPTFTAPTVFADTPIVFRLTVTNTDTLETDTDDVTITVLNFGLVAVAGADQTAQTGNLVTLSSAGSTSLSTGIVEYEWEQIWGPAVTLSNAGAASPTFTAPADSRAYSFRLHVRNRSNGQEVTDDVVINVVNPTQYLNIPTATQPRCADSNDARVLIGCADGILYTSDDMVEFFRINTGIVTSINGISNRPDGRAVFVSTDGIYYSQNGVNWSEVVDVYSGRIWIDVADSGTMFVAAAQDGYFGKSTNGQAWTVSLLASGHIPQGVASDGDQKFLILCNSGVIWYSSNNASSFNYVDVGTMGLTSAAYSPTLDRWVIGGAGYLGHFNDSNFGPSILGNITWAPGIGTTYYDVAWDPVNEVFIAVGFNQVSKSYDGINWTSVYTDVGSPGNIRGCATRSGKFVLASTTLNAIVVTPEFPS